MIRALENAALFVVIWVAVFAVPVLWLLSQPSPGERRAEIARQWHEAEQREAQRFLEYVRKHPGQFGFPKPDLAVPADKQRS